MVFRQRYLQTNLQTKKSAFIRLFLLKLIGSPFWPN